METVAFPTGLSAFRPGQYRVLPPEGDGPARLLDDAGALTPLHNRDAAGDARRLAALVADAADVVVIGLYPDDLLDALLAVDGRRVLVLEPDAGWAERVRQSPRGRRALATGRVTIHALDAPHDRLWEHFVDPAHAPAVLMHPVLRRAWPEAVAAAQAVAQRAFSGASANDTARHALAPRYLTHTLANAGRIARSLDVGTFSDRWAGRPAVLVAAGPSLDAALPALRARQQSAVVIATDTSLRPCLAAGVVPHFCVAVDPSDANGRHLADLCPPDRTWLCAEASVLPAAMRPFGDRLALFRVADHDPWPWLAGIGLQRSMLRAWGSVLTTAFDLAVAIGASPIVFVGADLAYTDGRPYCSGTTYERDWEALRAAGVAQLDIDRSYVRNPVVADDVHGQPTVTAPHLMSFRDWLVEQSAALGPGRVVNATGAGILHGPHIVQASLDTILRLDAPAVADVAAFVPATSGGGDDEGALATAVGTLLWEGRAAGNRGPATGNREPATGNRETATGDWGPGTGYRVPGTGDGDGAPQTGRREPGTGNREAGAGYRVPGTGDGAPRRASGTHSAEVTALLSSWERFTDGQVTAGAISEVLAGTAREHHLPRQPVVERRPDAPMAQEDEELLDAFDWMREIGPIGVYVEIGSRFGGSLYAMARYLGRETTLIAIDLPGGPAGHPDGPRVLAAVIDDLRAEGYDVHLIAGDSHAVETRRALVALLAGRTVDVLFLDADRSADGVRRDLTDYGALVRPGGIVLVHDLAEEPGPAAPDALRDDPDVRRTLADVRGAFLAASRGHRARYTTHKWGLGGFVVQP